MKLSKNLLIKEIKFLIAIDKSKIEKVIFRKGSCVIVFDRFLEQRPESCWYGLNGWFWAVTSKDYLDELYYESYFGGFRGSLLEAVIHSFKKIDARIEELDSRRRAINEV